MQTINELKTVQSIQLKILEYFHDVCKENGLRYMLCYGTLLGAVRHHGFIPWDDDIDVMMPRPDYLKLVDIMKNNGHPIYRFISLHSDRQYFAPLAKLFDSRTVLKQEYGQVEKTEIGVYIDIFILDGLPADPEKQIKVFKRSQRLRFYWGLSVRKINAESRNLLTAIIKTVFSLPFKMIGYRYFVHRLDQFSSRYDFDAASQVGVVCFGEGEKEIMNKDDILPVKSYEFESMHFNGPANEKKYLEQMYGDYMAIPPETNRKIHKSMIIIKDQFSLKEIIS